MLALESQPQLPVAEARAGQPEAWNALFARYQMPLYVYVVELVHNEQTALDIVQEAFINGARYIGRLQDDAKFGSWLFSIAHQKVIQHWRKRPAPEHLDEERISELPTEENDPRDWLIQKERETEFVALIDQLSEDHRAVLLLYFLEEFSLEEIAAITETAIGTVKSRMHYAKNALRKLVIKDRL